MIQWLLEQCSATVIAADSAAAAINEFKKTLRPAQKNPARPFDLLISDIAMPDQDGYDLIRQVRELERESAARSPLSGIALTAYVRERHRTQALAAGFGDYMAKPIDPETLISAALRLLQEKDGNIVRPEKSNAPASPAR